MYVAVVPNRNSPPAVLLREAGKVCNRTVANISHLPPHIIEAVRQALKGNTGASADPADVDITRSLPHGHVAAVVGSLRQLGLDSILDKEPGRQRDLCVAMIAARVLDPCSKLATDRG